IIVTIEESLNFPNLDEGPNERTTFEHSDYVLVTDVRSKVRTTGVAYAQNMQVTFM
ncbi:unnamed protein product, partial [Ilex paraguariensis]